MKYVRFVFLCFLFVIGVIGLLVPFGLVYASSQSWSGYSDSPPIVSEYPYQIIMGNPSYPYLYASDMPWYMNGSLIVTEGNYYFHQHYDGSWNDSSFKNAPPYSLTNHGLLESNTDIYSDSSMTSVYFERTAALSTPQEFLFNWDKYQETDNSKYNITVIEPFPSSPTINDYTDIHIKIENNSFIGVGVPSYPSSIYVNGKYISVTNDIVKRIDSSYLGGHATYKVTVPLLDIGINDIAITWKYNVPKEQGVKMSITKSYIQEGLQPGEVNPDTGEVYYPITDENNPYYDFNQNFNPNFGVGLVDGELSTDYSLTNVVNFLRNIGDFVGDIGSIMLGFFSFLPSPMPEMMVSGLGLFVALAVFKIIRG